MSNTMCATCGKETAHSSGELEFTFDISGVRVARSLVFCVVFSRALVVLFLFAIVWSVLRFTDSD